MHVRILSADLNGIDAYLVEIEVDVGGGLPGYHLVGLPATAVTEGRVRIRSALNNSGYQLPARKITVNLAPAEVRKDTSAFDLPIALGILAGLEHFPADRVDNLMAVGELSLDGSLRPVRGVLSVAAYAFKRGVGCLVVPEANGSEAALVSGLNVRTAKHLAEVVSFLASGASLPEAMVGSGLKKNGFQPEANLSEVHGQNGAKRALEVAAAGGHHLLMVGPPGSGKSMLAHRLAGLLPSMTLEEALESTKIYSVAGLGASESLRNIRPFRAPHHSVTDAGLLGGGVVPRPGELSLAHKGVLFLDESLEFKRSTLESLRQPIEDKKITVTRVSGAVTYPADVMLVLALNPCPCGHLGDPQRTCVCSTRQVARYQGRLSGPLLDRIDLFVEVPRLTFDELDRQPVGEPSDAVRSRVVAARRIQETRLSGSAQREGKEAASRCNAEMRLWEIRRYCKLDPAGRKVLKKASDRMGLSARAVHRTLKVARTVADLDGSVAIGRSHLSEAIGYRVVNWGRN